MTSCVQGGGSWIITLITNVLPTISKEYTSSLVIVVHFVGKEVQLQSKKDEQRMTFDVEQD